MSGAVPILRKLELALRGWTTYFRHAGPRPPLTTYATTRGTGSCCGCGPNTAVRPESRCDAATPFTDGGQSTTGSDCSTRQR